MRKFVCRLFHWCLIDLLIEKIGFDRRDFVVLFGTRFSIGEFRSMWRRFTGWMDNLTNDGCSSRGSNVIIGFITGMMTERIQTFRTMFLRKYSVWFVFQKNDLLNILYLYVSFLVVVDKSERDLISLIILCQSTHDKIHPNEEKQMK